MFMGALQAGASQARQLPAAQLVDMMVAGFGQHYLYEWLTGDQEVKVHFDVAALTGNTTAPQLLHEALSCVGTFFGGNAPSLLVAASHGEYKLSYHIIAQGVRMRSSDIKRRIRRLGLHMVLDIGVYGFNQKLRLVGSRKTPQDTRVFEMLDVEDRSRGTLMDTLVSVVDHGWPLLTD